jgi:hypothetical protein
MVGSQIAVERGLLIRLGPAAAGLPTTNFIWGSLVEHERILSRGA